MANKIKRLLGDHSEIALALAKNLEKIEEEKEEIEGNLKIADANEMTDDNILLKLTGLKKMIKMY